VGCKFGKTLKPNIMKNSIAILTILAFSLLTNKVFGSNPSDVIAQSWAQYEENMRADKLKLTIHTTITASNGCVFAIDGTVSGWINPHFTGTVVITCPGQSPKTYVFDFIVNSEGGPSLTYVSGDRETEWDAYIGSDTQLQADIGNYILSQL
jgi:hypothetical protein